MKVKEIQLFEFDELPEAIKAKVIEKYRDINTDYEWHDMSLADWKEKLEAMGFEEPKIAFRGFCCQGDGASFDCKNVDVEMFLASQKKKKDFEELVKAIKKGTVDVSASVIRIDHHYSHEYTVRGDVENSYLDNDDTGFTLQKQAQELEDLITEVVRNISRNIYMKLESEYEYLTSDKAVIETIEANEYTFRANGVMENE